MTDEITPFFPPSPEASFYRAHAALLTDCSRQPTNSSLAIAKGMAGDTGRPISGELLRELCAHMSVGNKVFCCIDHGEGGFEVHRLEDGSSAKLFYKFHKTPTFGLCLDDKAMQAIRGLLKGFNDLPIEEVLRYDKGYKIEMKAACVVAYSFIQRRMGCIAAFRSAPEGSTHKIKECLAALIQNGEIVQLSKEQASSQFNTSALLYKVHKIKSEV